MSDIIDGGDPVSPRGMLTYEHLGSLIELTQPELSVPVGVGRKLHLAIGAAESVQLIAGVSSADQLIACSPTFKQFTKHNRLLGAYGPRIGPQMRGVVDRLASDPDTRQAIVTVWRPDELNDPDNPDVPCTLSFAWTIRDGRLNMHTTMRSNDVWLGLPYDFMMFTRLQGALAWALQLPLGRYIHQVHSLHIYERNIEAALELHEYNDTPQPPMFIDDWDVDETDPHDRWAIVQTLALDCVLGRELPPWAPPSVAWFHKTLSHTWGDDRRLHPTGYVISAKDDDHE